MISLDPLAEVRDLIQRINAAWAAMTDEQREQGAEQHAKQLTKLDNLEEKIRKQMDSSAALKRMAEAYNNASPEEQGRPLSEWMNDYRLQGATDSGNEWHDR